MEIPVSWRRLFNGGESRVKTSDMTRIPRRMNYSSLLWKINFLGHEKHARAALPEDEFSLTLIIVFSGFP